MTSVWGKIALLFWFIYSPLAIMLWYEASPGTLLWFILVYAAGFAVFVGLLLIGKIAREKQPLEVEHEKTKEEPLPLLRTDVNLNQLDADDDILG